MRRKHRIRMHYLDQRQPSIEGLLLRRWPEYVVGTPQLLLDPSRDPAVLEDARRVCIPRPQVSFYEVLT